MKRWLCIFIAIVTLVTAPGLGAFQAAAAVVNQVSVAVPVGGANAGVVGAGLQNRTGQGALSVLTPGLSLGLTPALAGIQGVLPPIQGPAFAAPASAQQTATVLSVNPAVVPITQSEAVVAPTLAAPAALPQEQKDAVAAAAEAESLQTVRGQSNQLGVRFRQLRKLFGEPRQPADVLGAPGQTAQGLSPALSAETAAKDKPAVDEPAKPEKPKKGWGFGMNGTTWWFIGSLLAQQVGVEALGSSMPALIQKAFGDFTIYAQVAVVSSIFGIIGRQIAPVIIEKVGLKKAYVGSYMIRVASITALVALLATGHMTLPLMFLFYSANAFIMGTTFTAMNSVPPLLVGQQDAPLNRFWGVQHTLSEIFGVLGPIVTGLVIAHFGFIPALVAFPVMTLAAALILWTTLKLPAEAELKRAQDPSQKPAGVIQIFKDFFKKIGRGAKVVWSNPALRLSFIAFTLFLMLNPFLYQMLAPGYALRLIGTAAPELAPAISGWLTGLYSAGGLVGGIIMTLQSRKLDQAKESGQIDDAGERVILRQSMLRWIVIAAGSLAFIASLAVPLPVLGSLVSLPSFLMWAKNVTLPALALIPFGIAQVVAQFKLQSYFQARVPKQDMADAMGFLGSASLAVTTVGILALKYLFKAFPLGLTPFYYFSLALIPIALAALYLRWRLSKQG
ncbi:MAG: MFS transporter [Elusimicrobia bacterium]|nr:MFS transporter [Elusimicrobiota bacterium]